MATLQLRNGSYRILFCFEQQRHTYTLGKVTAKEAGLTAANADRILLRLEQGLLKVPPSVDIVTFIQSDGHVEETPTATVSLLSIADLRDRYVTAHSNGVMEESSLKTWSTHFRHTVDSLKPKFSIQKLSLADLQQHVDRRRLKKGIHGKPLSTATLKKEIGSLRAAWNWGVTLGMIQGTFPNRGLLYPKTDEKPPFQTLLEIQRQLALGGLSKTEVRDTWDCLFLTKDDLTDLIQLVSKEAEHGFLYPMVCFAAHTGARRSEMIRLRWHDIDFSTGTALLHEKKRRRSQRTTRRVPLSPLLAIVLQTWQKAHPGGPWVFCLPKKVSHSKKHRTDVVQLSRNEAHDHLNRVLKDSKWELMRGWHVLRHSFASNCAASGVDQRMIDEWMGHQTEEMRRRYRHLFPHQQQEAIQMVFGQSHLKVISG